MQGQFIHMGNSHTLRRPAAALLRLARDDGGLELELQPSGRQSRGVAWVESCPPELPTMSMDDQAAVHEAIENHRYNPGAWQEPSSSLFSIQRPASAASLSLAASPLDGRGVRARPAAAEILPNLEAYVDYQVSSPLTRAETSRPR